VKVDGGEEKIEEMFGCVCVCVLPTKHCAVLGKSFKLFIENSKFYQKTEI